MKKSLFTLALFMFVGLYSTAQKVEFEEYKLDNGLHVILHQENAAPIVTVGVMYQVGAKDEEQDSLIFSNTFYLKVLRISKEENGLISFLQMVEEITQIQLKIVHIITKPSHQIN